MSSTPFGAFLVIPPTLFIAELLSAWLVHEELDLHLLPALSFHVLTDLVVVTPMLYLLFARPASRHLRKQAELEQDLRRSRDALEQRVLERTAALRESNRKLVSEVAERRSAQDALRLSEERYESLVDNSPTGIFLVQGGRVVFANPRLGAILGYSMGELTGMDPLRLVHPDDRPRIRRVMADRSAGISVPESCDCRFLTRQGVPRWVTLRHVSIRVSDGHAMLVNLQDVTDQKVLENELNELSSRLLIVQEEERQRIAWELHDSIGQTLSLVKLTVDAVTGSTWPVERQADVIRLSELVPVIQGAIEELRHISNALRPPTLDKLGLIATINWHLRELGKVWPTVPVARTFGVTEPEIPESLKAPIFRIFQEATNNALKHSQTPRLDVGLVEEDGWLRFWLEDEGIGFDKESPARREGRGGSGLSSMRQRATLTGGVFELKSTPGRGTRIDAAWRLPAMPRETPTDDHSDA